MPLTEAERVVAMRKYRKKWRDSNPEKTQAAAARTYATFKERYASDPEFRAEHQRKNRETYRDREKGFDGYLRRQYGISYEQWVAMFTDQGGRCKVCRAELQTGKHTHVDHCHTTGKVRALLCRGCNQAVGITKEDPARIRALANYVEMHTGGDLNGTPES